MQLTSALRRPHEADRVYDLLQQVLDVPPPELQQYLNPRDQYEAQWLPEIHVKTHVQLQTRSLVSDKVLAQWYGWQLAALMSTMGRPACLKDFGGMRAPFIRYKGFAIPIVKAEEWAHANVRNITRCADMPAVFSFSHGWTPSADLEGYTRPLDLKLSALIDAQLQTMRQKCCP